MKKSVQKPRDRIRASVVLDANRLDLASLAKNTAKVILALAAVGAIVPLAIVAPNLPIALEFVASVFERTPRARARQALRRLQKQRLVEIQEKNGVATIVLTEQGKKRVLRFNLEYLQIQQPKQWDTIWRVIAFDIPEQFKKARRALRLKMRELGFYPLQKSVFVHPYPCRDEIDFVADFFDVGKYIHYIEAVHLDDETHLKEHFGIK